MGTIQTQPAWHKAPLLKKHLAGYLKEAVFRLNLNEGTMKHHALNRLSALALKIFCHRITYRELTHDDSPGCA